MNCGSMVLLKEKTSSSLQAASRRPQPSGRLLWSMPHPMPSSPVLHPLASTSGRDPQRITRLSTRWKHRCGKCGHEDWADTTYPRVAYLPIDAIGPDDSYT
jgi:hypothetical protein